MSGSPPPLSVNEPERAPLIETIKGPPRTIGLVQLVVLSYFITCGDAGRSALVSWQGSTRFRRRPVRH